MNYETRLHTAAQRRRSVLCRATRTSLKNNEDVRKMTEDNKTKTLKRIMKTKEKFKLKRKMTKAQNGNKKVIYHKKEFKREQEYTIKTREEERKMEDVEEEDDKEDQD